MAQASSSGGKKGFASKFGFIMAAAGSAIGLGNIWNFSYKLGHYGGGAFLVTYLFMVVVMGLVLAIAEMYIGQRSQKNVVGAYGAIHKRWAFVGVIAIIVVLLIASYYSVIGGWTLFTAFNSFNSNEVTNNVNGFLSFVDGGILPIILAFVFLALALIIICFGVAKGIERFSKIIMPVLFVLLIAVMIRSLTLGDGVLEGLTFMFHVDFTELGLEGVLAAMGQAFYSLSLGMGIMVTYGSYTGKEINLAKSSIIVALIDTAIAVIVGLAIFPAVFAFDLDAGSGITLMFETLPQVFAQMGGVGMLFSFLFFVLVFIAAITSMVSIMETGTAYFVDKFKVSKTKICIIIGSCLALVSAVVSISIGSALAGDASITIFGNDLLTFFDDMTNKILMPIGALCTCLCVNMWLKPETIVDEMHQNGHQFKFSKVWCIMLKFITPILIVIVLIAGVSSIITTTYGIFTVSVAIAIVAVTIIINQIKVNKQNKESGLGLEK